MEKGLEQGRMVVMAGRSWDSNEERSENFPSFFFLPPSFTFSPSHDSAVCGWIDTEGKQYFFLIFRFYFFSFSFCMVPWLPLPLYNATDTAVEDEIKIIFPLLLHIISITHQIQEGVSWCALKQSTFIRSILLLIEKLLEYIFIEILCNILKRMLTIFNSFF